MQCLKIYARFTDKLEFSLTRISEIIIIAKIPKKSLNNNNN